MKIYNTITELIGKTPLVELKNYSAKRNLEATIVAKVEFFNPGSSVKDRIALGMIEDAEKRGILKAGGTIIEPTSGNTGIGLALVAAAKGYHAIIVMPDTMTIERRMLITAYGAELVLTPGKDGMKGAIAKANELLTVYPNAIIPSQFENPINPGTHFHTTGEEIYNDTEGKVDIFVAGIGTGGTISGVGKYLKEKNPNIKIYGVEPKESPIITEGHSGPHGIQGIGAGFIPHTLNTSIYDEVLTIETTEAYEKAREIVREEGILVGISSGAALAAATIIARRSENKGKMIVVLLPDTGERYLSSPLFK